LFPTGDWKRYARWAVDQHDAGYGDPAGVADLRLVLARWIAKSRGVDASFRHLVVTSGAQQAFFLLVGACIGPGDTVAMEDPGYNRFRMMVEAQGAQVELVPIDDEGIIIEAIPAAARAVYVTPSHQFPTGVTMSMPRRLALLELATGELGAWVWSGRKSIVWTCSICQTFHRLTGMNEARSSTTTAPQYANSNALTWWRPHRTWPRRPRIDLTT
jgi:DNA-binding transcriptional MocR family regulator